MKWQQQQDNHFDRFNHVAVPDASGHSRSWIGRGLRAGFEPATETEATALPTGTSDNQRQPRAAMVLQTGGMDRPCLSSFDVDLHLVGAVWKELPCRIRESIMTLVNAADPA
jgi:hypothetical protein